MAKRSWQQIAEQEHEIMHEDKIKLQQAQLEIEQLKSQLADSERVINEQKRRLALGEESFASRMNEQAERLADAKLEQLRIVEADRAERSKPNVVMLSSKLVQKTNECCTIQDTSLSC